MSPHPSARLHDLLFDLRRRGRFFIGNFCINILKRKFILSARILLAFSVMIVSVVQAQALTAKAFQGIDVIRFYFS
jgi:hypothetical protein